MLIYFHNTSSLHTIFTYVMYEYTYGKQKYTQGTFLFIRFDGYKHITPSKPHTNVKKIPTKYIMGELLQCGTKNPRCKLNIDLRVCKGIPIEIYNGLCLGIIGLGVSVYILN